VAPQSIPHRITQVRSSLSVFTMPEVKDTLLNCRSSILECEVGRLRYTRELSGYDQPGQVGEHSIGSMLGLVLCTVIKGLEDQP
jgi:hypothetical protein